MRKHLFEFFRPTDDEFDILWKDATIIPDANVLLNLLRYNNKSSNEVLMLFNSIKNRIWLPYQVAYEFLNNHHKVFLSMEAPYGRLESLYKDISNNITAEIEKIKSEYRYHPSLDFDKHKSDVSTLMDNILSNLKSVRDSHPKATEAQRIVDSVADLFLGRVGDKFSAIEIDEYTKEASRRFSLEIPPGYCDNKKQNGGIGDFLIWNQIINFAIDRQSDIIFITDDIKEDWWLRVNGKTIGPRPELRREFSDKTSKNFYMYTLARWLELSRQKKGSLISSETVEEAKAHLDRDVRRHYTVRSMAKELLLKDQLLLEKRKELDRDLTNLQSDYASVMGKLIEIEETLIDADKYRIDNNQMDDEAQLGLERRRSRLHSELDRITSGMKLLKSELNDLSKENRRAFPLFYTNESTQKT